MVYRLVENAAAKANVNAGVPQSGISTDQKLGRFYEILSDHFDSVIIILDEVDLLVGRQRDPNDELAYSKPLYQLSQVSQIGLINGHVSVAALAADPARPQMISSILTTRRNNHATRTVYRQKQLVAKPYPQSYDN